MENKEAGFARALVRECGGNLNEAMTVALRRADNAANQYERYEDGQSASILREETQVVREIEKMISQR